MTIKINTNNKQLLEKIWWLLSHFSHEDLTISKEENTQKNVGNTDIFTLTKGLLSSHSVDPLEWQEKIRNDWDR